KRFKYHDDDSEKGEVYFAKQKSMHTCSSFDHQETDKHGDHKILFPRNMKNKFEDMRMKFGSTFFKVRRIFTKMKSVVNVDEVKELIIIWFPDLRSQLPDKKTIEEVLNVLKRKCNIFNIRPLENLAFEFNVEDAKPVIKSYKEEAKDFCKSVSVSLCLGEELQAVATPSRLLCETIVFVFNWDPDEYTLQDINDMFFELEPLNKCRIQIDNVGPSQSVVVNCYCPAEFTGSLILTILGKTDTLQRKGLKEFMVGNCTIWHTTQVLSESTEGADFLVQINDLKAALKAKDEWIMATEAEVAALKKLSENRLKEIGALKKHLEESHCINVQKEEVMNELKEEILVLRKEIIEKENLLNQLLEDTEKELASWKELSDNRLQEIERLQLIFEDNNIAQEHGKVENIVHLSNPSVEQCKDVNSKLNEEHKMIILDDSSSDSAQFLIPRILEKRIITLYISSSALTRNDVLSFSSQLSTNQSLTTLALFNNSISDDGYGTSTVTTI
uniref:Death domain-containing protein n=1 Tax=Amphimedon queenslandica TaxID=400682 RepID=A0A1X7UBJ3_AMPQE